MIVKKANTGESNMAHAGKKKSQEAFFTGTFSSFSVDDIEVAREFYANTLGVDVGDNEEGGLELNFPDGTSVFVYPKENHEPATFTVLNFLVDNIDEAVDDLADRGITFESYEGDMETDEKGIFRGADEDNGPNIAWFRDPAGNFLSVIEE
jgi:catechol 2,3-dioxygenase-like lactoylglutathione lyase family enzyme